MKKTRTYRLRKRAEGQAETRRRIVEATSELHREVGPAATSVSEVARRAGVHRITIYEHFPDEAALFGACSAHWRALHPAPELAVWGDVESAGARLRTGLRQLYAWFRETEPMTANVLRDAERMPALRTIVDGGIGAYLTRAREVLATPLPRRKAVTAAIRAATDFHFWQSLASLGDAAAAELGAGLVELAARARR
ncbi:MAG TPA: helix-turn-helix domain-containing protein [Gemmatimonadaceae bacterium]|nr:helix-turn-helix domain-containing protein [Gemmatimonadaceae bacterium]